MKLQILPNWCKKLGVTMFIVFSFISAGDDFIKGFNEGSNYNKTEKTIEQDSNFKDYFGENLLHWFDVISIFGILIYMLSREKIEDDYISQLRLESYQITAIVGLSISILLYAFSEEIKLTLDYFITLFMYFYLITFFIKKRIY
ncbi:hypothetical protein [Lutibacter citreus]|uniref:hypothetical protein n=1 Tax=Lutibacter citreus TaxID=2138210 RepID=UPI000DBE5FAE|nr:hypothetical protein [Lutibacter citreus]